MKPSNTLYTTALLLITTHLTTANIWEFRMDGWNPPQGDTSIMELQEGVSADITALPPKAQFFCISSRLDTSCGKYVGKLTHEMCSLHCKCSDRSGETKCIALGECSREKVSYPTFALEVSVVSRAH